MDLKSTIDSRLTSDFISGVYSEIDNLHHINNDSFLGKCPYLANHSGKKTSNFSVDCDPNTMGRYNCFGCNASGNIYTYLKDIKGVDRPLLFLAKELKIDLKEFDEGNKKEDGLEIKNVISKEEILKHKQFLFSNAHLLDLLESFGISKEVAKKYNLGWHKGRYWIPVKDVHGDFVNVRKYDPDNQTGMKVISYGKGFGQNRIWPIENLNANDIYMFEGEKDTLLALSMGFNAITTTAGAKSWSKEWGALFKGRNVTICLDIDEQGLSGAKRRAESIVKFASQVKVLHLELDIEKYPGGDFSDYIINDKHTKQDFLDLVESTEVFNNGEFDSDVSKVILSEASKGKYIDKKCRIENILVCGKDSSPFASPKKLMYRCTGERGKHKKCNNCALLVEDLDCNFEKDDPILLKMIKVADDVVSKTLKKYAGVNSSCHENEPEILEYYNIENIRIIPDITYNIEENYEHVYRSGFVVSDKGAFVQTNKSYDINALTTLDSKTQYVVHQIYNIDTSGSDIDNFSLTGEIIEQLKKFQVTDKTVSGVWDKLTDIYREFSIMSRIYERNDIFLAMDLSYHSPLTFDFQKKNIGKGWVEVAIVGDTGVGKSTQVKFLSQHYRCGEIISGEGSSYAGLVGGVSQQSSVWSLQWGRLPLNDRRLAVIEEATGISELDISKLSEIRSSGEAKIQKIVTESTRARTRIIWIANPRKSNLGIKNYSYGVMAVKELFGMPEDIRRVDLAMVSASGDISPEMMNKEPEILVPTYDSDSCHKLVQFIWSLKGSSVFITNESESKVIEGALYLSSRYTPSLPLIEPSEVRNKIIRLSVALAARLFNVDENNNILVEPYHVETIVKFIDANYSSRSFGYLRYSAQEMEKSAIKNEKEVCRILNLRDSENVTELLMSATISKTDLQDLVMEDLTMDRQDARRAIRKLKKYNAIREVDKCYIIKPGLMNMVKDLKEHYDLGNSYSKFIETIDEKKEAATILEDLIKFD